MKLYRIRLWFSWKWFYFKRWFILTKDQISGKNPYRLQSGGNCPVQIEGFTKEGKWFYFRARGNNIQFVICNDEDDYRGILGRLEGDSYLFERELQYGKDQYQAGWMPHDDAIRLCTVWLNEWYEKQDKFKISKKALKILNNPK